MRPKDTRRRGGSHRCGLLIIVSLLLLQVHLASAQCPWRRDSIELHSDCICDFNPSITTNLESQHPVNRMSVQCSPVDFENLLRALKQTASIELPEQLFKLPVPRLITPEQELQAAGFQLASQAKLDLLHISNSSINQLRDNTFIMDIPNNHLGSSTTASSATTTTASSANNSDSSAPESRHLVVAIQSLHLSRCNLERIQPQAFNGLEWSLTSLSLSDNELEFVPLTALSRLVHLRVLDLSNNRLIQIPANSFATLNKLNTLRLADNRLSQKVDLMAFVGLEASLSDLNLKNAQLASFPLAIKSLRNLAFLNLAQNQISHVPPRSFEHMNALTAINLERNRISRIDNDTFLGVESSLSSLSLLGNLLEVFPVNQLSKLASVRRLDMGFNRIESLPVNAFASNKRLILVALDGNPLDTLPEAAFKPLEGVLRGLSIGGKALNCDCRLSWMLRWQQEFNMQISSRERQPQFCAKPHYLRSLVSFSALKPEHLTCASALSPPAYAPVLFTQLAQNTSGGPAWFTANNEHQPTYFTLPILFRHEPPVTTTAQFLAKTPFELVTTATAEPEPSTTAATRSTAGEPTTTENPLGSETTTITEDDNGITESNMDLTEAGTNEEPTLRTGDVGEVGSTKPSVEQVSSRGPPSASTGGPRGFFGERGSGSNQNSLRSLPEDELFVTDSSKKLNRNGFLPATPKQRPPAAAGGLLEEILRHSTAANMTKSQRTAAQSLLNSLDVIRRNKTTTFSVQESGNSTRAKPIQSVFGSRANENRRAQTATVSTPSSKAPSSTPASSASPIHKGARFVEEASGSSTQVPRVSPSPQQSGTANKHPPSPPSSEMRLVDTDIERYAIAASSISPRVSASSNTGAASTTAAPTVHPIPVNFEPAKIETTTSSPSTTPGGSSTRQSFANNTRMSVSSMYRLATSSTPPTKPAAATSPAPILSPHGTSLEAAAEDASHKIMRTVPTTTPQPSTIVYPRPAQQQVATTRAVSESRRPTQQAEAATTQQMSARNWANKTSASPTSVASARVPPPTTPSSTRPPQTEPALGTTTRMAATVRVVEGATPILRLANYTTTSQPPLTVHTSESRAAGHQQTDPPPLVGVVTLNRLPHVGGIATGRPPVAVFGEQQHETKLTLSPSSRQRLTPDQSVVVGSSSEPASVEQPPTGGGASVGQVGGVEKPVTVQASELLTTRDWQPPVTQQTQSARKPKDDSFRHEQAPGERAFLGKLMRLTDFDQVALVLASLLCIFILVLALTVIGVCCTSGCASGGHNQNASRLPSFSSSTGSQQQQRRRRLASCLSWWCCWLGERQVTPMRSLIMSDDDNSSGSGSSNGHKSTGKSMLLSGSSLSRGQDLLVESIREASMRVSRSKQQQPGKQKKQSEAPGNSRPVGSLAKKRIRSYDGLSSGADDQLRPIDHEASIQRHRLAHALDQEYFVGVSRGVGRRQSMVVLKGRATGDESDEWVREDALSSCDSDKSCSPGANRNNRYNISEAHRAYLASKSAQQIQASMYVTTSFSGGSPKSGLLKTMERQDEHLERLSRISSDKSTTDDSRAPLSGHLKGGRRQQGLCTLRTASSKSFGGPALHRSRSIGRLPAPEMSYPTGVERSSLGCDFLNSDLVPMSAEEQWPEPYVEPPEEGEGRESEYGAKLNEQFASYRGPESGGPGRRAQRRSTAANPHRAHDEAYLANWHTMSRARPPYLHPSQPGEAAGQQLANFQQPSDPQQQQVSSLVRYSSIPSSLNGNQQSQQLPRAQNNSHLHQPPQAQQQQQQPHLLASQVTGATNWLRWTPTNFTSQAALGADSSTPVGRGWHRDNHVEAVYIAANQQR